MVYFGKTSDFALGVLSCLAVAIGFDELNGIQLFFGARHARR